MFHQLTREQIKDIVKIQLRLLQKRLDARKIKLDVSEAALNFLATEGFNPAYGARPLKRVIQKELENILAQKILAGEVLAESTVQVDHQHSGLTFKSTK